MKLTNEQLKKIYFGALFFEETEDGYVQAFQYSHEQMDYFKRVSDFWYERSFASTAKTLEAVTSATEISFDYSIIWKGSEDSIELEVDGLIEKIDLVKDLPLKGTMKYTLKEGEKNVRIYLPADATILIKNFEINGEYEPAKKGEKVLWLGDSITQGFGPLRSACTYVSVANRIFNFDILNQGIGGYVYDPTVIVEMGYRPSKIIVAMGTNQFGDDCMPQIDEYYKKLTALYPNVPILAVTPIWRGDVENGLPRLTQFCEELKEVLGRYKDVTIVEGFKLVPHLPEYFLDKLHPNCHGCEVYGRNLAEEIKKAWF